jgi:hypothetical protein
LQLFQLIMPWWPLGSIFTTTTWLVLSSARHDRSIRARMLLGFLLLIASPPVCVLPGRAEGAYLNLSQHPRQQNMQLISNWKNALKMSSVQAGGAIAALGIAEQMLPQLQAVLPPAAYGVLGILVMLARVILQPKLSN